MTPTEPPSTLTPAVRAPGWRMVARCVTALFGGYAATAAIVTLLSRLLPIARVEAVLWAMLAAPLVYVSIVLWCFREPRLGRVAAIVWGAALLAGGAAWLIGVRP